ncbi:tetratricopeptide repeat protein [Colwellia sp. RSH04]|uniref:tetratricopeptide repeat protein n=1 Tax=Colwellia sp. RSH04 TaxID=2305464 RepID=UPI00217528F0|nr:tetratricopeptide repeat protein [Colwellia sp. RSH04]
MSFSSYSEGSNLKKGIYELNRGEFQAAKALLMPLVEQQYAPAQYYMATMYKNGHGVPKDAMKALALFQKSAERNYPDAQFELALLYTEGKVVKKDLKMAYQLTRKAAKKGLAGAQFNLAVMYAEGKGVQQNNFKASRWYISAADLNFALAQYNLALLYSEGKGVEKSTELSYVWNTIASWNGYPDAETSRLIDERALTKKKILLAREKANQIYQKILEQQEIKAKISENKRFL